MGRAWEVVSSDPRRLPRPIRPLPAFLLRAIHNWLTPPLIIPEMSGTSLLAGSERSKQKAESGDSPRDGRGGG